MSSGYRRSFVVSETRANEVFGTDRISSRVLTERLRVLEQKGFVFRDYEPTIPLR
jgi:DNA-binding HxlR family transcriptional regulator